MPSKTECSCVLTPTSRYDDFIRKNCEAEVDGKCLDHVYGRLDSGDLELHSLRYRLAEGWTNEAAKSHCKSRDGDFEPATQEDNMETQTQERSREKFLYAPMVTKITDETDGITYYRYHFTGDGMDELGDTVQRDGTIKATKAWRKWRNIRLQHDQSRPIGKAVRIGEDDGLDWNMMDVRVDDPSVIPLVDSEDPVLGAASVGIIVNEWEDDEDEEAIKRSPWGKPWIITDYTMVEISLVDHPANYDAVAVGPVESGRSRILFRLSDAQEVAEMTKRKKKEPESDVVMGATSFADLPFLDDDNHAWDADAAKARVAKWASSDGSGDKDTIDWEKYRKAFFWYDPSEAELLGGYKFPFADVFDGTLKAVWHGVTQARVRVEGSSIPDEDKGSVLAHIKKYCAKHNTDWEEAIDESESKQLPEVEPEPEALPEDAVPDETDEPVSEPEVVETPEESSAAESAPVEEAPVEEVESAPNVFAFNTTGNVAITTATPLPALQRLLQKDKGEDELTPEEEDEDQMGLLDQIYEAVTNIGKQIEAIHKAVCEAEAEQSAPSDSEPTQPEEAILPTEQAPVESHEPMAEPPVQEAVQEPEAEVEDNGTKSIAQMVAEEVNRQIAERKKLLPRKSLAVEHTKEDETEPETEEQPQVPANGRARLRQATEEFVRAKIGG